MMSNERKALLDRMNTMSNTEFINFMETFMQSTRNAEAFVEELEVLINEA